MAAPLHRIVTLTENANGHPHPSQFPEGDIDLARVSILPTHSDDTRFYIAFNPDPKSNHQWPGGGHWPRYIAYRHSPGLYVLFFRPGVGGYRTTWAEADPRNGLRGYPYCNQVGHDWREFKCSGLDMSLPPGERAFYSVHWRFTPAQQPPPCNEVTQENYWEIGNYRIMQLVPSINHTLAGWALPEYPSAQADEQDGDELD